LNAANFSTCNLYRYWLQRDISPPVDRERTRCLWVMLNPSTADCTVNDPTIGRCMDFTAQWRYDDMEVVNLFAYRSTNPKLLLLPKIKPIAVGPDNNTWILKRAALADLVICAWGAHKFVKERGVDVLAMLKTVVPPVLIGCIGRTRDGYPKHPLYVPGNTKLEQFA
jgi:hypothetical protein